MIAKRLAKRGRKLSHYLLLAWLLFGFTVPLTPLQAFAQETAPAQTPTSTDCNPADYGNPNVCEKVRRAQGIYLVDDFKQDDTCSAGGTGGVAVPDALAKQTKLDKQWIDLITKVAAEKGIDPIFMAGLLYVENAGWPEYKTSGWPANPDRGSGPWQITAGSWPSAAGPYSGSQDPVIATPVAAELIKGMGGDVSPLPMGSIKDDFSRGKDPKTVAALGKNYNAGRGTWRQPGVAGYKDPGRIWTTADGPWSSTKNTIIDNYILTFQYVYYHIATGQEVPAQRDNDAYASAALAMIDTIEHFSGAGAGAVSSSSGQTVIALDPGHGGPNKIDRVDSETGLHDGDYQNEPEATQVYDVAMRVKAGLESSGYKVVMTKNDVDQSVFLRDRANIANNAKAALAVSIHTQGNKNFGTWQEIYVQKVGLYRGEGAKRTEFTNAALAEKSQSYAGTMKTSRDATEVTSGTTVIKDNVFDGQEGKEPGNIPLVELWATVPWIYLEAGGKTPSSEGLGDAEKSTYATSIINGIKQAVPTTGATGGSSTSCGVSSNAGGAVGTAINYAWPNYRGRNYVNMKPEYAAAVERAKDKGEYIGGVKYPGIDCGGFVTRVMLDSGFEPGYNEAGKGGFTGIQLGWVRAHWQKLGKISSTSQLQPGDVAFRVQFDGVNDRHTFMFVGKNPGFETEIASASLDDRAPMAGREKAVANDIEWYRKK